MIGPRASPGRTPLSLGLVSLDEESPAWPSVRRFLLSLEINMLGLIARGEMFKTLKEL